jgi:8-oxo-dGTP diphosphatase
MKAYVLGFAFDKAKLTVILIEKQKPEWQKGLLNGVGGKVELTDTDIYHAMVREFYEETGLQTELREWQHFADMIFANDVMGGSAIVHCFRIFTSAIINCRTMEQERIIHYDLRHPQQKPLIKNLKVLIPMAMDKDFDFCKLNLL